MTNSNSLENDFYQSELKKEKGSIGNVKHVFVSANGETNNWNERQEGKIQSEISWLASENMAGDHY